MKYYIIANVNGEWLIESHRSTEQTAGAVVKRLNAVGVDSFVVSGSDLSGVLDQWHSRHPAEAVSA